MEPEYSPAVCSLPEGEVEQAGETRRSGNPRQPLWEKLPQSRLLARYPGELLAFSLLLLLTLSSEIYSGCIVQAISHVNSAYFSTKCMEM